VQHLEKRERRGRTARQPRTKRMARRSSTQAEEAVVIPVPPAAAELPGPAEVCKRVFFFSCAIYIFGRLDFLIFMCG
jgi:hypothetical protein